VQKFSCFFLFLFAFPLLIHAQQRTKVVLQHSEVAEIDARTKINRVKKPVFEHDGAILTCDSARFWSELNYFEAFGNVHINQGDTIHIYSDLLNYDGNAKMAHLINNVRMHDRTSTLTTNIFDYNMATRVGNYIDKGKVVNKEATITSKRGFYFARSNDAYFRYDVVAVTDQVTITSDTLRYNTATDQTYFYGPTNIKGKDDNLYTENGQYNTKTEKAFFGKNNLYTKDTQTLKGDSLFYDGKKGYGKAVKNIVFHDSRDKLLLEGQLGEYYKADERVVVTINAYVGLGTSDTVTVKDVRVPDTLWLGADTLEAQMTLQHTLKLIAKPVVLSDDEVGEETSPADNGNAKNGLVVEDPVVADKPSTTAKTLPDDKALRPVSGNTSKQTGKEPPPEKTTDSLANAGLKKAPPDSLQTTIKGKDSSAVHPSDKVPKKTDSLITKPDPGMAKTIVKESIPENPADTIRTRTIKAYHKVKVFKTNLQARADSLFFAAADSTLRFYQNPIVWSDSTQQTGDTIHVQFKNKKINSAQIFQNAFIADQEPDTTKFNQIKGKVITAFFNDGEIKNMYVDGNAESIYYDKKADGQYQLNQTISARIKIIFLDKEMNTVKAVKGIEGVFSTKESEKENILSGFIWKPELRPKDKADVIGPPQKAAKPVKPKNPAPVVKPKQKKKV